ncbi:unnamed protein product [Porites lobata]|uniref:Uncharacterized protein n=1 Tax=Porites lobata TaxID=104759 RepID=A0ABN8R0W7_9CNID|nr:unnamed protein product [Porites lobata]
MGHVNKCLYLSRSCYHTAVSRSWPHHFRTEFQRFFQSGEKPIIYSFNKRPSDALMHRGAYGLSLAGIFISFYGVYFMVQDTYSKKQPK